jgi:hypothetical protein
MAMPVPQYLGGGNHRTLLQPSCTLRLVPSILVPLAQLTPEIIPIARVVLEAESPA